MKIIVSHRKTIEEAIVIVDRSANDLFEGAVGGPVELVDRRKTWYGQRMDFSLTARVGFISLPISGTVEVDEVNVTVLCELPPIAKTFLGEDKIHASIERKVRGMLAP